MVMKTLFVCVIAGKQKVVDENAYPDSTIRRSKNVTRQQGAGRISLPEVVLKIQTLGSRIDQRKAPPQRLGVVIEQQEPRFTRARPPGGFLTQSLQRPLLCGL
jgi:hypothetical protein